MENIKRILSTEYYLWWIAGGLVSARFFVAYFSRSNDLFDLINIHYFELLLGIVIAIFPFVFYQIFGSYPLQSIRNIKKVVSPQIVVSGSDNVIHVPKEENETEYAPISTGVGLLTQLTKNAEDLANKIYRRSGVYLIFGVLIAFSGILYFSFQSLTVSGEIETTKLIIALLPRFGILFFIELIAFFFLKQYRAAMDEFRHYDAIKRSRESQLAIYLMATRDFEEKDFTTVVESVNFYENIGKLSNGETTELIELGKLNKNELEILKGLIGALAKGESAVKDDKSNKST